MVPWPFKKDPKKERKREIMRRAAQHSLPKFADLLTEYGKLSRKEKKRYREISEDGRFFVKSGVPDYYDNTDLYSIARNSREFDRLRTAVEREIRVVEEYLSKHPEIPDNIKSLILRFSLLGLDLLEDVAIQDSP